MTETALTQESFSEAKAQLSAVMSRVVRDHAPTLVSRRDETMLLVGPADVEPLLSSYEFSTVAAVEQGEFVLHQPELGLIATGGSFEEATRNLERAVSEYTADFIDRWGFHMNTPSRNHWGYLLRLALVDPERRRELLMGSDPRGT